MPLENHTDILVYSWKIQNYSERKVSSFNTTWQVWHPGTASNVVEFVINYKWHWQMLIDNNYQLNCSWCMIQNMGELDWPVTFAIQPHISVHHCLYKTLYCTPMKCTYCNHLYKDESSLLPVLAAEESFQGWVEKLKGL